MRLMLVKLVIVVDQKRNLISNQKSRVAAERDLYRNKWRMRSYKG